MARYTGAWARWSPRCFNPRTREGATGFTAGEIWLDVKFNAKGKLTGTSIAYEQGPVNPLRLQDEEPDESEEFFYSFHVATVQDKVVYQHMLGTIQIPVNYGTFYPYGPAV